MISIDGYSMKEKAKKIFDSFSQDKKNSLIHCKLVIDEEFYGSAKQNFYRKIQSEIKSYPDNK